jgi:hypothetical protein
VEFETFMGRVSKLHQNHIEENRQPSGEEQSGVRKSRRLPMIEISDRKPGIKTIAIRTLLGKVLYLAAVTSREMNYFNEKEMARECLYSTPPLHPPRPLYQSRYATMPGKGNLRDQALYQATAPQTYHMPYDCKRGYQQCSESIHKTPKVVMVNQLWLWILDGSKLPLYSSTDSEVTFFC